MATKDLMKSPADPIAKPSKGSPGIYDGKHKNDFGKYPRTKSKDGVPEKHYDTNAPFGKFPAQD